MFHSIGEMEAVLRVWKCWSCGLFITEKGEHGFPCTGRKGSGQRLAAAPGSRKRLCGVHNGRQGGNQAERVGGVNQTSLTRQLASPAPANMTEHEHEWIDASFEFGWKVMECVDCGKTICVPP